MGQGLIDWSRVLSFQYTFAPVPFIYAREDNQGVLRLGYLCLAFAWLLQLMLSSATLLQPFRSCQISLQKTTGLNGQPLRNFLTKLFGFSCFALFLKSHANLWSWSLYLGMYPPPGILTRKGLSSTEIRKDIYSPD